MATLIILTLRGTVYTASMDIDIDLAYKTALVLNILIPIGAGLWTLVFKKICFLKRPCARIVNA
jgi:hypothetical protein